MDKKRAANFTPDEEQLLVGLVEKYKNVIECKKSGVVTWKQKEATWKLIGDQFNSRASSSSFKCNKTLKVKYANLKSKTKEKYSLNKQNILKTGGGTSKVEDFTDIDITIKDIIGAQIDGLENNCDSDTIVQSAENEENYIIYEGEVEEGIIIEDNDVQNETVTIFEEKSKSDWSDYCSENLKQPVATKLKVLREKNIPHDKPIHSRRNAATKKYVGINHELIQEKIDFIKLQRDKFLEEHSLKIELLKKQIQLTEKQLLK